MRYFVDEDGPTPLTAGCTIWTAFMFVVIVLAVACRYVITGGLP